MTLSRFGDRARIVAGTFARSLDLLEQDGRTADQMPLVGVLLDLGVSSLLNSTMAVAGFRFDRTRPSTCVWTHSWPHRG
jgi:16S rRNA C1402 N4-methylase RsmH